MATPDEARAFTERLADQVGKTANEIKQRTAAAFLRTVVLSNPKYTGTARFNWRVGLGGPELFFKQLAFDRSEASMAEESIPRGLLTIDQARPGEAIHVSSIVPYVPSLDNGEHPHANVGFINRARLASLNVAGDAARFIETELSGPVFRG